LAAGRSSFSKPIRIPVAVDQPQWLLRLPDDTLTLLEQERWASPLRDEFRHALIDSLSNRYGALDVRSGGSGAVVWRVYVGVTRFESQTGEAWLESTWSLGPRNVETPALRLQVIVPGNFGRRHCGARPGAAPDRREARRGDRRSTADARPRRTGPLPDLTLEALQSAGSYREPSGFSLGVSVAADALPPRGVLLLSCGRSGLRPVCATEKTDEPIGNLRNACGSDGSRRLQQANGCTGRHCDRGARQCVCPAGP
jgi:hypothetical protein